MRFVQIETLPAGKALVDIDKLTHAVPEVRDRACFWEPSTLTCRTRCPSLRTSWRAAIATMMARTVGRGLASASI
jgi:hypothetical protein